MIICLVLVIAWTKLLEFFLDLLYMKELMRMTISIHSTTDINRNAKDSDVASA